VQCVDVLLEVKKCFGAFRKTNGTIVDTCSVERAESLGLGEGGSLHVKARLDKVRDAGEGRSAPDQPISPRMILITYTPTQHLRYQRHSNFCTQQQSTDKREIRLPDEHNMMIVAFPQRSVMLGPMPLSSTIWLQRNTVCGRCHELLPVVP
jgi:hypothetical protein